MDGGRRSWIRATLWVGLAGAALVLWFNIAGAIRIVPPEDAVPASPLTLVDSRGREFSLEAYRGKVLVLNLWADWCGPCRVEIPGLTRVEQELGGRGLAVVGVNADGLAPERLTAVGSELGLGYRSAVAFSPLQGTFGATDVLPITWLLDREGRVRAAHSGLVSESALRKACLRLLAE